METEVLSDRALTSAEIARFRHDGFLLVEAITTPAETEQLRGIFTRMFGQRVGWEKGAQFDLAGTDDASATASLPQILNPADLVPELRETQFRAQALRLARQLLGPETEPWFEHAIMKPAERGGATPWHQDEAHRDDVGVDYEQVSIWMPLQPATVENGCMRYIPGSHLGPVLEHRSPNNDPRVMALECTGPFDEAEMVPCPLPAGGAAIHHSRTLHSAGPNSTTAPRMAYVLAFRGPIRTGTDFQGYAWNREKRTAAQARSEAWEKRGGLLGQASRKAGKVAIDGLRRVRSRLGRWWR